MKTRKRMAMTAMLIFSMFMFTTFNATSKELDGTICEITPDFFFTPYQMGSWNVGFEMIQMPRSVTGEELLYLPMVNAEYRVDVSDEVNVKLMFNSCYIINLSGINVNYTTRARNFKFEAGLTGKYWFGNADLDLIKANGNGLSVSPSVSGTYFLEDHAFIAKAETDFFVNSKYSLQGGSYKRDVVHNSGTSLSLTYQQPFFGNVRLNFTAKVNVTELNYQQWILYSASDRKYVLPSFGVGLSF